MTTTEDKIEAQAKHDTDRMLLVPDEEWQHRINAALSGNGKLQEKAREESSRLACGIALRSIAKGLFAGRRVRRFSIEFAPIDDEHLPEGQTVVALPGNSLVDDRAREEMARGFDRQSMRYLDRSLVELNRLGMIPPGPSENTDQAEPDMRTRGDAAVKQTSTA